MDSADKKGGFATPIRELLQNSIDAVRETGEKSCKINIYLENIATDRIPHLDEYKKVLQQAITTAKNRSETNDDGSFNASTAQQVEAIKGALANKEQPMLLFSDNGVGMPPNRLNAMFLRGVSIKRDEGSVGSRGVGHLSSYALSALRYVLYATKYIDNGRTQTLFTGSPILAGHKDEFGFDRGKQGCILRNKPEEEKSPEFNYPATTPSGMEFIADKIQSLDHGTLVCILGLNNAWDEDAEYVIVSNYFHAIKYAGLDVTIHKDHDSKTISCTDIDKLVAGRKDQPNKQGDAILSGKAVHQAWLAVKEDKNRHEIILDDHNKVDVFIKTDSDADTTIVLVRSGMVVARHDCMLSNHMMQLRNNTKFEPFTAVINVTVHDAKPLFELVKGSESAYHNKLEASEISKVKKNELRGLLKDLSEKIKLHLVPVNRKSFDFPMFRVHNREQAHTTGTGSGAGQSIIATPTRRPRDPRHGQRTKQKTSGRLVPTIPNRNLSVKAASRYTDIGDKWIVRLNVTMPADKKSNDDVYLFFSLNEDTDGASNLTPLSLGKVTVNSKDMGKIAPATPLELTGLHAGQLTEIEAEVMKPAGIGNMKTALMSTFRLKKRELKKV